mmetsp:Transcript_17624/g.42191  ORF Transcript_17624/g.42191 Transcript_17624/m.42191 type:complete len:947 (-) Transcript_17624:130-2970(-)
MDFAVVDVNGVGPEDPTLLSARGSDPLLIVPNSHLFHRIGGMNFQTSPGSLVPDSVHYSQLEALAAGCIFVDPSTAGVAYNRSILTHHILPSKLDAALSQLQLEPTSVTGLYPERTFDSLSEAVAAVRAAVVRLDIYQLSPSYRLTQTDTYRVESIPDGAHQLMRNLGGSTDAPPLTYGSMVRNGKDFFYHGAFLGYVSMGRTRTTTRDSPGCPTRVTLEIINEFAISAGLIRTDTLLTPASLLGWLELTEPPGFFQLLEERGTSLDRREQNLRNRHQLVFGSDDQKELLICRMVCQRPLSSSLPNLSKILSGGNRPPSEVRLSLHRLVQEVLQKDVVIKDLSLIHRLEPQLTPLVHCLSAPALLDEPSLEKRVSAVLEMRSRVGPRSGGTLHFDASSTSSAVSASRIWAAHFSDDLARAMTSPEWLSIEATLEAALLHIPVNPLRIHSVLMQSPVVGVRKLALGCADTTMSSAILAHSKVLLRALSEVESNWKLIASQFLVCDLTTFSVASPDLMSFRLSDRVCNALRRGAFSEIDWIGDILCEVQQAENPNLERAEYADGLFDPRVFFWLDPLLKRVSRLLGLPITPPVAAPSGATAGPSGSAAAVSGATPGPSSAPPFSSLSSIASTVSSENVDIMIQPSPFNEDYLLQLKRFESMAWEEASEEFSRRLVVSRNPVGTLPTSLLLPTSAAFAVLSRMVESKHRQRREAVANPTQHALLSDYRAGKLGGRFSRGSPSRKEAAPSRSRSRSPVRVRGESSSRARSRSRSPQAERDRSKSSPPKGDRQRTSSEQRGRGRSSIAAPGSRVNDTLRFSPDGTGFYYVSPTTGARASPVYDFATLEQLSGRTREELCFPVLLSRKPFDSRITLCPSCDHPKHATMASPAHIPPFSDFVDKVAQHFEQPTGSWPSPAGSPSWAKRSSRTPSRMRREEAAATDSGDKKRLR